jgi:aminoglycoside phosphotransferase (APT) family kinase protein
VLLAPRMGVVAQWARSFMADAHLNRLIQVHFPESIVTGIARLTGGVSADVHRIDLDDRGAPRSVVVREHGERHGGHPASIEFALLQALHESGVLVPKPLALDISKTVSEHDCLVIEHIAGDSNVPDVEVDHYLAQAADALAGIHEKVLQGLTGLPALPDRLEPLPEVFDYWPEGKEWQPLKRFLQQHNWPSFSGSHSLLHGDFWPENLLWKNGVLAAVLDWEDAAVGDPLSDLAASRVEFRYQFGREGMQIFTSAYSRHRAIDATRLALWQIYVAAAGQHFMGDWGLPVDRVQHMRRVALSAIREAGEALMSGKGLVEMDRERHTEF